MSLRIFSFPGQSKNPYLGLFYQALEPYGVEHDAGFWLSPRWVLNELGPGDVLHFHWPGILWKHDKTKRKNLLKLWLMLMAARRKGVKVMWTVHNLVLHEDKGAVGRIGQRVLARYSDLLIVHRESLVQETRQHLRTSVPIVVMAHGNYKGYYPEPRPRAEVMRELGVAEDQTLLCCVGRLRGYKALDVACNALRHLDDGITLVIAGVPHDGYDMAMLENYAAALPNLVLVPRMLSDQEVVDILGASEATLLPYRQITGSGALFLAWSCGCGVVASDLACFRETIPDDSAAGIRFETGNPEALARAVQTYLEIPYAERKEAAYAESAKYDWDRCIEPVGAVLQQWQGTTPVRHSVPTVQPAA